MTNIYHPYKVLGPLGHGSFGNVMLVEHLKNQKRYAMKVIKSTKNTYNKIKEKVENEIKFLKDNPHKNIVQFIDVFEK